MADRQHQESGTDAQANSASLTWDKLAQRRPAPLGFRLIPSERLLLRGSRRSSSAPPLRYLTPCLSLEDDARQAPVLRIIDPSPSGESFVSLSSLCLLASPPPSPLTVLLALDLRRGQHWETSLNGAEPLEDVKNGEIWLRLGVARDVARAMGVEQAAEAFLSEARAWSLDEGHEGAIVHNWLPSNPSLAAASISTTTLLAHRFSTLTCIRPKKVGAPSTYSTLISEAQRRELTRAWQDQSRGWSDVRRTLMKWTIDLVERIQDGEEEQDTTYDGRTERIVELLLAALGLERCSVFAPLQQLLMEASSTQRQEAQRLEDLWRLMEGTCALAAMRNAPPNDAPQQHQIEAPSHAQAVEAELLSGQRRIEALVQDLATRAYHTEPASTPPPRVQSSAPHKLPLLPRSISNISGIQLHIEVQSGTRAIVVASAIATAVFALLVIAID